MMAELPNRKLHEKFNCVSRRHSHFCHKNLNVKDKIKIKITHGCSFL